MARRFTIGVFQDLGWADKGVAALAKHGFPMESLTVLGRDSAELRAFIEKHLSGAPETLTIDGVGPVAAKGPLVADLQGEGQDLATAGIRGTIARAGFQKHDGQIYERLTARGGVLVAVHNEPRAADALATLLAYGGGNAAIGAWTGRV